MSASLFPLYPAAPAEIPDLSNKVKKPQVPEKAAEEIVGPVLDDDEGVGVETKME